jgi:hypothetical protein
MTTINCPKSWAEIKLEDYLQFYRQVKPYENTEQYEEKSILFATFNFTDITEDEYLSLPESTFSEIKTNLLKLLNSYELPIVKSFEIQNVKYGFIPSLDDMAYGEYLDLVAYSSKDIWNNIPVLMSVLYRPITKSLAKSYTIEKYNGTKPETIELFSQALTMDIVFGAISFFLHLQRDLVSATLTYLVTQTEMIQNKEVQAALQDLGKSGVDITQLPSLLNKTFQSLTQLQS